MVSALRAWCEKEDEFTDVLDLLVDEAPIEPAGVVKESPPIETAAFQLSNDLLPPIIACLADLATGSSQVVAEVQRRGLNEELEFERRTGIAFRLLGLETEQLGQGTGRQADGVAVCPEQKWAIIYDAKLRQGPYRMGTEDRKFREYVERHKPVLTRSGIANIYFVVVSGSFVGSDLNKAREVVRLTGAKSCVLLSVEALLRLVELRLSDPRSFDYHWLERHFLVTQVLSADGIGGFQTWEAG